VDAAGEQEVFMYSGLEAERTALHRQRAVAWAWIKARGVVKNRVGSNAAKLTRSVLLTSDCSQAEEISSWRESLATHNYRCLAKQICDQFYDLSILTERHSAATGAGAAERALGTALPFACAADAKAQLMDGQGGEKTSVRARIMSAVLPDRRARRGAVLIPIRNRAA
jgi:hypothetical protein